MTERWRVLDDRWTNPFTGEPERHICKSRADDATVIAVEGPHCDDDARWVAAALNAVDGVPTEVLEAGVVVVPVEELRKRLPALIRATAEMVLSERRKLDNDQLDEELKDLSALSQTTAKMESKLGSFIEWLSRLPQSGAQTEPPSRYTVTLTDEERQIVCEALSVYTDHCAEYEDHPTAAVRETASTKKLKAWAILSRLQQHGGWWETGDQEPRRLREDCYEPGQQMGGGHV